jgi:hypothetical protein
VRCAELGQLLAVPAAAALAGDEHESDLRAGTSNRDLIGQAKSPASSSTPERFPAATAAGD